MLVTVPLKLLESFLERLLGCLTQRDGLEVQREVVSSLLYILAQVSQINKTLRPFAYSTLRGVSISEAHFFKILTLVLLGKKSISVNRIALQKIAK